MKDIQFSLYEYYPEKYRTSQLKTFIFKGQIGGYIS